MRCSKANEFLSLEMDGVLPPDATVDLRDHLDGCKDCSQYREDLLMGSRMLEATEPELPENFDWKLQLRLNQTLKESVGEVAYPWADVGVSRWAWMRNFTTAAAVGMAAVLAVAVFSGPMNSPQNMSADAVQSVVGADRLPLESSSFTRGNGLGRAVSSSSPFKVPSQRSRVIDRGWSGQNLEDLRTITHLRNQNEELGRMLVQTQLQMQLMRAQLDSTEDNVLDLHQNHSGPRQ